MTTFLELYDNAVEKLLKRGYPSKSNITDECYYRHPTTGDACLIGLMINDSFYQKDFEGLALDSEIYKAICCSHGIEYRFNLKILSWISDAQRIHDYVDPSFWKEKFAEHRKLYPGEK